MNALRLLFAAAFFLLAACTPQVPDKPSRVALWEVSGANGERGWIFGTVHALPPDTAWQRPAIADAIASADRLVMELGGPVDQAALAKTLAQMGHTPGLPHPSARVRHERQQSVASAFAQAGLDEARFDETETWAVALQLAGAASQKSGVSAGDGVEQSLRRMAEGRPIVGLETVEGQFTLFDRLPDKTQSFLLEQTAADIISARDEEADLLALWLNGDEAGIANAVGRGFLADPTLRHALLTRRNADWVVKIEGLLKQGARPFVAVGAAHVAGAEGLPALLAARGWKVTRVP